PGRRRHGGLPRASKPSDNRIRPRHGRQPAFDVHQRYAVGGPADLPGPPTHAISGHSNLCCNGARSTAAHAGRGLPTGERGRRRVLTTMVAAVTAGVLAGPWLRGLVVGQTGGYCRP